jgi:snurportin-1
MSNFKDLYKFNDKKETTQAARRAQLLEQQREKRQLQYSSARDEETEKVQKRFKTNQNYRNILMLSEWMDELPLDIEDFILVPCPKGIRCTLVVDSQTSTLHYKNGKEFLTKIKSNLPKDTILDCFYVKNSKSIYILDVLQYKGRDFISCDFAFRSYWIKSKFSEDEFVLYGGDLTLKMIDTYDFNDPMAIAHCYETHPIFTDGTELDGFLYYHKEGSYTFGESPLVLWLFAFMVEELMPPYKVNAHYNSLKPDNYSNYKQYISDFNEKYKKKERRSKGSEMEFEISTEIIEEDPVQQSIDLETYGEY